MKHVRKFLALTLVLVLALGIVGCAAPAAPDTSDAQAPAEQTTDESKPIKLTLWSCNDMIRPNELKEGQETWYISQAIERFRELYPNVTIEWARSKPVGGLEIDTSQWFITQIAGGSCPAIAFSWGTAYEERGYYLDLTDYLNYSNPYVGLQHLEGYL